MKDKETIEKLATAMEKLADNLEKFQDPVVWQKVLNDAVEVMPALRGAIPIPIPGVVGAAIPFRIEGVSITLSDEEREKLVERVHAAIQPQLTNFNTFVKEALRDMPPGRLERIGKEIDAGKPPSLKQRHGCIFVEVGDVDAYLPL